MTWRILFLFFFVATFRWQVDVPEFPAFVLFLWFYFIEKFVIGGAVHLFSWLKWAESDDDNDCDRRIWPLGTRIWQQWPPSLKPSSGLVNKRNITQRGIRPFLLLRPSLPFKEKSQQAPPISLLFTFRSHLLSDFFKKLNWFWIWIFNNFNKLHLNNFQIIIILLLNYLFEIFLKIIFIHLFWGGGTMESGRLLLLLLPVWVGEKKRFTTAFAPFSPLAPYLAYLCNYLYVACLWWSAAAPARTPAGHVRDGHFVLFFFTVPNGRKKKIFRKNEFSSWLASKLIEVAWECWTSFVCLWCRRDLNISRENVVQFTSSELFFKKRGASRLIELNNKKNGGRCVACY